MFTLFLMCLFILFLAGELFVCYRIARFLLARAGTRTWDYLPLTPNAADSGRQNQFVTTATHAKESSPMPAAESIAMPKRISILDSLTLRTMLVGVLAMLMLVPLAFVNNIVTERGQRYQTVLDDIARNWGNHQVLMAPVLVVPFTEVRTVQRYGQHS